MSLEADLTSLASDKAARDAYLARNALETATYPTARFVVFYSADDLADSLDLADALHEQTLLAYGMNGAELPMEHGAPLRLRVPRQLGYKSVKYLSRIYVTDSLRGIGSGKGSISPDLGYSWYAGI